jgi:hypothetical protein
MYRSFRSPLYAEEAEWFWESGPESQSYYAWALFILPTYVAGLLFYSAQYRIGSARLAVFLEREGELIRRHM